MAFEPPSPDSFVPPSPDELDGGVAVAQPQDVVAKAREQGYVGRGEFAADAGQAPTGNEADQSYLAKPAKSLTNLLFGFAKGIPQAVKFLAPPSVGEGLQNVVQSAAETGSQVLTAKNAPVGSQPWWDAVVNLSGQAAMGLGLKEGITGPKVPEAPPIQLSETLGFKQPEALPIESKTGAPEPVESVSPTTGEVPITPNEPTATSELSPAEPIPAKPAETVPAQEAAEPIGVTDTLAELNKKNGRAPELPTPENNGLGQATTPEGENKVPSESPPAVAENGQPPVEQTPVGATPEGAAPETTGVANRVLESEAKAGKIGEVEPGEGMTWQEMVDLGREQLKSGADPAKIAADFKKNGRLSPTDFAVLRAERERLAVESNKAADAAKANPNDPAVKQALVDARKAETDFIRDTVQPAKTSTSDIFRGMQGEAPIDASTFEGLRRGFIDHTKGREPTPAESKSLERRAEKVQKAQQAESKANQRLGEAIDKQLPKTRTPTLEELQSEMSKMAEELTPCQL